MGNRQTQKILPGMEWPRKIGPFSYPKHKNQAKTDKGLRKEDCLVGEKKEFKDRYLSATFNYNGKISLSYFFEDSYFSWKVYDEVRKHSKTIREDRILSDDVNSILNLIKSGNLLNVLKNKRLNIKNLILGLAMEEPDNNKIISSLTSNSRKKLTLPITIVPANI